VKALVLAAGYATRLYPLTRDRPKPLLPVGGRPILEHLLERLAPIESLDGVSVVTNARFADQFRGWADEYEPPRRELRPTIIDDGTTSDEDKLGAIGDLALVLERERVDEDLIVVAGDGLFSESLAGFGRFSAGRETPVLAVYDVGDLETVKRYSEIVVDEDGRVVGFEEKPKRPTSTLAGIALYFYPRAVFPLIRQYVDDGNDADQPGRLIEWLYTRVRVSTWQVPGRWLDIGSPDTLAEADRVFTETAQS
jgi:glucose-1-phosphate thymidylyltransferase